MRRGMYLAYWRFWQVHIWEVYVPIVILAAYFIILQVSSSVTRMTTGRRWIAKRLELNLTTVHLISEEWVLLMELHEIVLRVRPHLLRYLDLGLCCYLDFLWHREGRIWNVWQLRNIHRIAHVTSHGRIGR
jgi:hypothetical protein